MNTSNIMLEYTDIEGDSFCAANYLEIDKAIFDIEWLFQFILFEEFMQRIIQNVLSWKRSQGSPGPAQGSFKNDTMCLRALFEYLLGFF